MGIALDQWKRRLAQACTEFATGPRKARISISSSSNVLDRPYAEGGYVHDSPGGDDLERA